MDWRNTNQRFDRNIAHILRDDTLKLIANYGFNIRDKETLLEKVKRHPIVALHADEIMEILNEARAQDFNDPNSGAFQEWMNWTATKRVNHNKSFAKESIVSESEQEREGKKRRRDEWLSAQLPQKGVSEPRNSSQRRVRKLPRIDVLIEESRMMDSIPSSTQNQTSSRDVSSRESTILAPRSPNIRNRRRPKGAAVNRLSM